MFTLRRYKSLFQLAGALIATSFSLAACNVAGPAPRQISPAASAAGTTASAQVSNGAQAVQIGANSSALNLTLPAGALTSLISQLGTVTVTAQMVGANSLTTAEQAAVQAGTPKGATLLTAVQLDVSAAGSSTKSLRTQQTASGTLTLNLQLPAGTTCQTNTVIIKQVASGVTTTLLGKLQTDQATHRQVVGTATATFGTQHLVFVIYCLPVPAGLNAKPLALGKPVPAPSRSSSPPPNSTVSPLKFTQPATPFAQTIPGAILTVSETDFQGQEDQFFKDSTIGATVTNYDFDILGTDDSTGGQAQQAEADVTLTSAGMHRVEIDEELFPVQSDDDNVATLTDDTTGAVLTMFADAELQNITIEQGDQLSVLRAKHLTAKALKAAAAEQLDIAANPDGTWLINGQGASTPEAAAQLVLQSSIGSGTTVHDLVMLLALMANQQFLLEEPTLSPTPVGHSFTSFANGMHTSGSFAVKQVALSPAEINLTQLLHAIIVQLLQRSKP